MFKWLVTALGSKVVFVPIQLAIAGFLIVAHIAMLGFFVYAIKFFYDKYNDLLQLVTDMSTSSDILALSLQFLQSLGVINAFNDVFSIFSPFIIAFLVFKAGKMVYHSFKVTSDEVFKIGVLIQQ